MHKYVPASSGERKSSAVGLGFNTKGAFAGVGTLDLGCSWDENREV